MDDTWSRPPAAEACRNSSMRTSPRRGCSQPPSAFGAGHRSPQRQSGHEERLATRDGHAHDQRDLFTLASAAKHAALTSSHRHHKNAFLWLTALAPRAQALRLAGAKGRANEPGRTTSPETAANAANHSRARRPAGDAIAALAVRLT